MKLYSEDFFITPQQHIAVEPRVPQPIFPEHTHDFSEIFGDSRRWPACT